ncbi:MAG: hypothetical protein DRG27_02205 [Deltaproteobacteria bacterium]|nr:MAG: hypothetical protein DRG27_02205 [Deltaproteobacteria bacterium]
MNRIAIIALILIFPASVYAHGVMGKIGKGGIVVTAQYDTGEPMSYAKVEISAPNSKLPFQSGRTDRNGRFCFLPDTAGTWKVVVDDEIGHRLELEIPVNTALEVKEKALKQNFVDHYLSRYTKAIIGICLIFGFFGCILGWRGKKGRS